MELLLYRSETVATLVFLSFKAHELLSELDRWRPCLEHDRTTDEIIDRSWVFMQLIERFFISEEGSEFWVTWELLLTTIIDSDILWMGLSVWELPEIDLGLFLVKELFFCNRLKLTGLLDLFVSYSLLSVISLKFSSRLFTIRIDFFLLILIFVFLSSTYGFLNPSNNWICLLFKDTWMLL